MDFFSTSGWIGLVVGVIVFVLVAVIVISCAKRKSVSVRASTSTQPVPMPMPVQIPQQQPPVPYQTSYQQSPYQQTPYYHTVHATHASSHPYPHFPHPHPQHHQHPHQHQQHHPPHTVLFPTQPLQTYLPHTRREAQPTDNDHALRPGVSDTISLDELNTFDAKGDDRQSPCPICLAPLEEEPVSTGNCLHLAHTSCLKTWLVKDTKFACPVCRVPLTDTAHGEVPAVLAAPG